MCSAFCRADRPGTARQIPIASFCPERHLYYPCEQTDVLNTSASPLTITAAATMLCIKETDAS